MEEKRKPISADAAKENSLFIMQNYKTPKSLYIFLTKLQLQLQETKRL